MRIQYYSAIAEGSQKRTEGEGGQERKARGFGVATRNIGTRGATSGRCETEIDGCQVVGK